MEFCGSQKNKDVRSVEAELEKGLYKLKMISDCNYGDLKRIGWGRATRTDKKVHALQNTFSAKVLCANTPMIPVRNEEGVITEFKKCSLDEHLEDLRLQLNEVLPSDVKVFSLLFVSNRFHAKNFTSFREYSYFLPTFMLTPITSLYLAAPIRPMTDEETKEKSSKHVVVRVISGGIKKIIRQSGVEDELEDQNNIHTDRNISHITPEMYEQMYSTRLTADQKEKLQTQWASFEGTKKYHNFTKDIKSHEAAAARYMMKMTANEFMYVNKETYAVTDENDANAIEFVRFFLKGQSFLFNQIRKMVGAMIQVFHGGLGPSFIENTHRDNTLMVAVSPGDGLLLELVAYENYNHLPSTKEPIMIKTRVQKEEVDAYRVGLVSYIAQRELKDKAFTCWLSWFDDNKEDYYASLHGNSGEHVEAALLKQGEGDGVAEDL